MVVPFLFLFTGKGISPAGFTRNHRPLFGVSGTLVLKGIGVGVLA